MIKLSVHKDVGKLVSTAALFNGKKNSQWSIGA